MDGRATAEGIRLRFGSAIVAANLAGALVVFVLLLFVLPAPPVRHPGTLRLLSVIAFVLVSAIGFPLAWHWSAGIWRQRLGWAMAGTAPTERDRDLVLGFPLVQQKIAVVMWLAAAVIFAGLTAPFSIELSFNVCVTVLLGGLVTSALGYLFGERLLRPVAVLALEAGVPERPSLPGVMARTLLSWTLGTGVVLLGIALVGIGGASDSRFTRERLLVAMLVLSLLGLLIGLLTMLALARSVADPIRALRAAAARVERGDLEHGVPVDDGSEIGLLQAGFNRMIAGLRERERIRDLFGRQVGEDVVRHALERGVELGGEAREAAVLFIDIAGSTTLAENRDPAEVVTLLNEFFAVVVDVVGRHRGWVNKFEGDAALCVFGAPIADPDASSCALGAARELTARLEREVPALSAGIGVSAGRVVAGNIGAARRFEYTVIGDPVNVAARLCELAKRDPGRALASESALVLANPAEVARWRIVEEVSLRGRSTPTAVAAPVLEREAGRLATGQAAD